MRRETARASYEPSTLDLERRAKLVGPLGVHGPCLILKHELFVAPDARGALLRASDRFRREQNKAKQSRPARGGTYGDGYVPQKSASAPNNANEEEDNGAHEGDGELEEGTHGGRAGRRGSGRRAGKTELEGWRWTRV